MKEYGQDLKEKLNEAELSISNVQNKIEKRFRLIVDVYHQYLSEEQMNYIQSVGMSDLTAEKKLEIMIEVESKYENETEQLGLFN
jgi:hypothetical protein